MFTKLAEFTKKYRVIITVVWLAAAVILFLVAPKISKVGVTDESQFLPKDTESAEAGNLLSEKFPSTSATSGSNAVIVIHDVNGLSATDMNDAQGIYNWLMSGSAPKEITQVISIYQNAALRSTLISTDQTTMMIIVDFSVSSLSDGAKTDVQEIRNYMSQNYPKLEAYLTGETGLFQDMFASIQQTIGRTTIVTVILVAILLLIIYRSPIAIFLPLVAIGCSFAVSSGIIGFLGQAGAKFSTLSEAYLVVVIFGVGTDYCLFIVSRFREELKQKERDEAQIHATKHISPVIAASALTVIVAFLSLGISRFGMNTTTGYALAIGVAITLIAGLTLVPALMSLFGNILFWPAKITGVNKKESRFGWRVVGNWVSKHPIIVVIPILVVLLLPYTALPQLVRSADIISQLPQKAQSVVGFNVMNAHFPAGELSPLYLLIESPQGNITSSSSLKAVEEIAQSLQSVQGVSRVDYFSAPSSQLSSLAIQARSIGNDVGKGSGLDEIALLQTSGQLLQSLALQYPGIIQSQNFQQATANLSQVSTVAAQISSATLADLPAIFGQLQSAIDNVADNLNGLAGEFELQGNTPFTLYLQNTYFSSDNTITRINIVLSGDPYSSGTINTVAQIRKVVNSSVSVSTLAGSTHYLGGESATSADIMLTNDADFDRVVGLSIAGIIIVIMIIMQSLVAPLYMVATVLLNYGTTLGIATWLFLDVMKQGSMIYMIPLFIFVILVALGADYNIFLMSRIREEAHQGPMREAVSHAVANTGGVITACGIILAGTFATLITAPLRVVVQIGAAIAVGVIIDTFVVRALLVPAIATLVGRWSWWPSSLFKKLSK